MAEPVFLSWAGQESEISNILKVILGNQHRNGLLTHLSLRIKLRYMRKYFNRLHTSALKAFKAELCLVFTPKEYLTS